MNLQLHKPLSLISGTINLPGSKSISNRVLLIKAISGLSFSIQNISDSDDTKALVKAFRDIEKGKSIIDIGHAGTDMRFLTAYLATSQHACELTGSERMQQRPIKELVNVLQQLGSDITYKNTEDYPPLLIKGKQLHGGKATINGNVSSQFISALLLVAPYFTNGLELVLEGDVVSKPYINMTIEIMKTFGALVEWTIDCIVVKPKPYHYSQDDFIIESDWSAASYFYSLVALSKHPANITLHGLFKTSLQADAVCATLFSDFSVTTLHTKNGVVLKKEGNTGAKLFDYDFTDCPDIAQTLACTCLGLNIPFYFTGLKTLKVKETDRIIALQTEFKKFRKELSITENTIKFITDDSSLITYHKQLIISTYHDHRMAMAFAPLCVVVDNMVIEQASVVSKSYPNYWNDLKKVGIISQAAK